MIAPGVEAWAILHRTNGDGDRRVVVGAARVKVEAELGADLFRVSVVRGSGTLPGHTYELTAGELYDTTGPRHAEFGELVARIWGGVK